MADRGQDLRKLCPACGALNLTDQQFCGQCGVSLEVAQVVRPVKVLASGLTHAEQREQEKRRQWIILAVLGVVLVCGCVGTSIFGGLLGSPDSEKSVSEKSTIVPELTMMPETKETAMVAAPESTEIPRPTETPKPTETLELTATPAPIAPPFTEIRDTVQGMTEVQWKAYLGSLGGQRVEDWQGWVVDVDRSLSGDYEVWVDMDPPDALSAQDIYLPVTEEIAVALNKGQQIAFSGTIDRVSEFLGSISVTLEEGVELKLQ